MDAKSRRVMTPQWRPSLKRRRRRVKKAKTRATRVCTSTKLVFRPASEIFCVVFNHAVFGSGMAKSVRALYTLSHGLAWHSHMLLRCHRRSGPLGIQNAIHKSYKPVKSRWWNAMFSGGWSLIACEWKWSSFEVRSTIHLRPFPSCFQANAKQLRHISSCANKTFSLISRMV